METAARETDPFSAVRNLTPVGSVLAAVSVFPAALACLKPLTFAGELKDGTVVDQAIDHRCRRHGIRKDVRPIGKREVGADGDALALVPARDDLKQQVGRLAFEWNVSEFIDQEQVVALQGSQPCDRAVPHALPRLNP